MDSVSGGDGVIFLGHPQSIMIRLSWEDFPVVMGRLGRFSRKASW